MEPEIEAKFLNVDHDDLRSRLLALGAVCEKPMRLMRRVIMDFPDARLHNGQRGWLRVRDEGDKITFTYKYQRDKTVTGVREVETTVGDFDKTVALCEAIGLKVFSFQESKRETWNLADSEVVLDEWPWVSPYIEIEGPTEVAIRAAAEQLGFSWSDDAVFGGTTAVYKHEYANIQEGETIGEIAEIRFNAPLPVWLEERR